MRRPAAAVVGVFLGSVLLIGAKIGTRAPMDLGAAVSDELTSLAMPHATVTIAVTQNEVPAPERPAGPQLRFGGGWVRAGSHGVDDV